MSLQIRSFSYGGAWLSVSDSSVCRDCSFKASPRTSASEEQHFSQTSRVRVSTTGELLPAVLAMEKSLPTPVPFPDTIVLESKGEHKATVVLLHGLTSSGQLWAERLRSFDALHPNVKWILPTSSFMKVDLTGQFCNAWYNATDIFKEGHIIDLEGLDKSAERIVGILTSETANVGGEKVKLVLGGFSQGCATSLYITRCLIVGKYSNGKPFPNLKLDGVIGLGGWMPIIKTFEDEVKEVPDARQKAQEIPFFFGHCEDDNIIPAGLTPTAARSFANVGVKDITVKLYPEGGHGCIPEEMDDLCAWMASKLGLDQPE